MISFSLAVHFFVGGQQPQLFGAAHQDFVVDQLFEDAQAQAGGLLADRHLVGAGGLVLVVLLHVGAVDFPAIDGGGNVGTGLLGSTARGNHQEADGNECNRTATQEIVFQIRPSTLATGLYFDGAGTLFAGRKL